jgi:hypothetical protein
MEIVSVIGKVLFKHFSAVVFAALWYNKKSKITLGIIWRA